MGSRAFLFLGLLFAVFLLASEVSARELAETEQIDETKGLEEYPGGGCGPFGCGGLLCPYCCGGHCCGGGKLPGRCCYGCCGGYRCRCCASAAEAEAYAAAHAKAKPQN